jgi:hypothetical protein
MHDICIRMEVIDIYERITCRFCVDNHLTDQKAG